MTPHNDNEDAMLPSIRPMLSVRSAIVLIMALSVSPPSTAAERPKTSGLRQSASAPPVKECTRFNGRFGYYANPWCNAAEQDRWDRWEAARVKAK
jgi:hypothetical protein